jgi:DNA methylase
VNTFKRPIGPQNREGTRTEGTGARIRASHGGATDAPKLRRALTHVGGDVHVRGDQRLGEALAHALTVPASSQGPQTDEDEDPTRAHLHGFHSYPARLHPLTAARLIEAFAPSEKDTVFDPFCGSGTVLIEAIRLGRRCVGTDLNPLAAELSRLKLMPLTPEQMDQLTLAADSAAAFASERRKARAGATRRFGPADVAEFQPHVLLELDSLRAGIRDATPPETRAHLLLCLSAILTKVSQRTGDSGERGGVAKRIAAGYTTKLFTKKTEELLQRKCTFDALCRDGDSSVPKPRVWAKVTVDDATSLRTVAERSASLVVTSPPYAATYDYVEHHRTRLRWLGLPERAFEQREMGARREYAGLSPASATARWLGELQAFFEALRRTLRPSAYVALVIADSAVGASPLRADDLVPEAAEEVGFRRIAIASQQRPHFHRDTLDTFRDEPRREHALLLQLA